MKNTVFNLNRDLNISTLSVGDTVTYRNKDWYERFKDDINILKKYDELTFLPGFDKYLGKSFKILELTSKNNIKLDNGLYASLYMLEEIKPKKSVEKWVQYYKGDINSCKEIFDTTISKRKNEFKEKFIITLKKSKLITNIKTENYE